MLEQIYTYFTIDMLFYWVNLGVLPFWIILIFFSHSNLSRYITTSIVPIFLLGSTYLFVLYKSYLNSYDFISNFNLYLGIDDLSDLFSDDYFLILFWIHFISINLFTGGWIVKDSQKLSMNKVMLVIPLIITYLIGPLGIFVYWLIRIFHAKSLNLYD